MVWASPAPDLVRSRRGRGLPAGRTRFETSRLGRGGSLTQAGRLVPPRRTQARAERGGAFPVGGVARTSGRHDPQAEMGCRRVEIPVVMQ